MKQAWSSFWHNYFNFSGRSTRSEYWWFVLDNFIIGIILGIIMGIGQALDRGRTGFFTIITYIPYVLYMLAIIIPSIALQIRRLHDVGKSGWWLLICMALSFVCGIGSIILIVFMCLDSVPDNQWGPNPKGYFMGQNPYNMGNPYGGQPNQNPYNNPYSNNQYGNNQNQNYYDPNQNNQNGPY